MILNRFNITLFFKYIENRHNVYKRKINGEPWPWTEDLILQKYKFTNVFRDLDPGTTFIKNILASLENLEDVLFNIIVYRLFNRIETFEVLGVQSFSSFSRTILERKVRNIQSKQIPVFTNAFTVSPYSFIKSEPDKIGRVCWIIEKIQFDLPRILKRIDDEKSSLHTFQALKSLSGIGEFLAYQIAVDLGYWDKNFYDENLHVIAGPGCKKGINYLFTKREKSYINCIKFLEANQNRWFETLNVNPTILFNDRKDKKLNLMALENNLCKISKYLKVYYNEGRPRIRYKVRST
jgi:abortive infection bacteriophage resistance protein